MAEQLIAYCPPPMYMAIENPEYYDQQNPRFLPLSLGAQLGTYILKRKLGFGGYATVWLGAYVILKAVLTSGTRERNQNPPP